MTKNTSMETTRPGFMTRMTTLTMTHRRVGARYKFLLFFTFYNCFVWFYFLDYFSDGDLPFEPKVICNQTEKQQ